MKQTKFYLLAAAGLLLASCSNEENLVTPSTDGEYANVTLNLSVPELQTRAYDDGGAANHLQYAVFTKEGKYIYDEELKDANGTPIAFSGKTSITLQLAKDYEYKVVLFAAHKDSDDSDGSEASGAYTVDFEAEGGPTMSVPYGSLKANDKNLDAFYTHLDIPKVEGDKQLNAELKRPFAQINVGTNDYDKYEKSSKAVVKTSSIKISEAPKTLNLLDGTVSEEVQKDVVFESKAIASRKASTSDGIYEKYPKNGYDYLAMAYVLVGENTNVDIEISYEIEPNIGTAPIVVKNVPLKPNYRTNIYGHLLTGNYNLGVEVKPGFDTEDDIDLDGAEVKFNDKTGKIDCITPALPIEVQEEELENMGGVYINDKGEPVIFQPTGADVNKAMQEAEVIYFAPNSIITTDQHTMKITKPNVTIYGNGATIEGGALDFALESSYEDNSEINVNIYDLNNARVWNGPTGNFILNLYFKNCTMTGADRKDGTNNMVMIRRDDDKCVATVNIRAKDCYIQTTQLGFHTVYAGSLVFDNCKFKDVGIPLNYAKKAQGNADITMINCEFNRCGISTLETTNSAYKYAAPVRVVNNSGVENSVTLTLNKCKFEDKQSPMDILLMDYREDKKDNWLPVTHEIIDCDPSDPVVWENFDDVDL